VDEHALAAQTGLTGIPVAADDHRLDGRIDVGVRADDHGVGATQLEGHVLEVGRGELCHMPSDLG
jgi:hypothetical protein